MRLPNPRGTVSEWLIEALERRPHPFDFAVPAYLDSDDLQLALFICYQLPRFAVDRGWLGHPSIVTLRSRLETAFRVDIDNPAEPFGGTDEPTLIEHLARDADLAQFREFAIHRSMFTARDAVGFRDLMCALALEPAPGAYLNDAPAVTLAVANAASYFGMPGRSRAVLRGYLAAAERATASAYRQCADGLRRLGFGPSATRFYDELAAAAAGPVPAATPQERVGAAAGEALYRGFAEHLLNQWSWRQSSLRVPAFVL